MASFCSNCGFPIGENIGFCSKCGARQAAAAAPAKGGSALKIVLIVVGILMFFGVAAVGGLLYVAHRVKQAVVAEAESHGVDLTPIRASSSSSAKDHKKVCDFLSNQEVSQILGEPIDRSGVEDLSCIYYAPPGVGSKLAQENMGDLIHQAQSGQNQPADVTKMLQKLAGSTVGAEQGEPPMLILGIDYDGGPQWAALQASSAIFGGIPGANISTPVPGLGDRAMRMVPLGLNVLKGSTVIRIVPGPVPGADAKSIAIARAVLERM